MSAEPQYSFFAISTYGLCDSIDGRHGQFGSGGCILVNLRLGVLAHVDVKECYLKIVSLGDGVSAEVVVAVLGHGEVGFKVHIVHNGRGGNNAYGHGLGSSVGAYPHLTVLIPRHIRPGAMYITPVMVGLAGLEGDARRDEPVVHGCVTMVVASGDGSAQVLCAGVVGRAPHPESVVVVAVDDGEVFLVHFVVVVGNVDVVGCFLTLTHADAVGGDFIADEVFQG
jgi:hypothetical protein